MIEELQGPFAGGDSYITGNLVCGNLGFESDADTDLTMGANWKICKRLAHCKRRRDKFMGLLDETERNLKTHKEKREAQLTDKHKTQMRDFKKRIRKLKSICEKLENSVSHLNIANTDQNEESHIKVRDKLFTNVLVRFGKSKVRNSTLSTGVQLNFKERNGTHMRPLEDKEKVAQIPGSDKGKDSGEEEAPPKGA